MSGSRRRTAALVAGLLLVAVNACPASDVVRLSEPVEASDQWEVFGAPMTDKRKGVGVRDAVAQLGEADSGDVRMTTRIDRVCQKKGCFFIAREGETVIRVKFLDYGFFIPTDASGQLATLVGTLTRSPISQAQADHYAEDMGDAARPLADPFEYVIEATSVLIERG